MAIVGIDFIKWLRVQCFSFNPVLHMNMFVGKNYRGMSMMISRGSLVEDFKVLRKLILINFEEEVWLGLDIAIHILRESFSLLALKLLLKVKSIKLLLHKLCNAALDLFQVFMVAFFDLRDLSIDSLFLLRWSQLREPFGFSRCLFTLLFIVGLRVVLELLELATMESYVIFFWLGSSGSFLSFDIVLDSYATESASAARIKHALQERLVCCCTLKEHIFLTKRYI